jgi:UDP-N-acetylglucosamine 2-epimerase (non-hydrolysing)
MRVVSVCGARPNVVKLAALSHAFEAEPRIEAHIVHTDQHYDDCLSSDLFRELGVPAPDVHLGVGAGTPIVQTAEILRRFDAVLQDLEPQWVVVVGDVTSTLACALGAAQRGIPLAHVEAGLRSFDGRMPEELNRTITDHLSTLLFVTEPSGVDNLRREGIESSRVHLVGNVMIDTLLRERRRAETSDVLVRLGLTASRYVVATVHRPENVDAPETLRPIVDALQALARDCPVAFAVHPRTRSRLESFGAWAPLAALEGIRLVDPLGYHEFLHLEASAAAVITDSGGVQEETAVLGVPCLTIRRSTERPITLERGSNGLVAPTPTAILEAWSAVVRGRWPITNPPDLWDGRAAARITEILVNGATAAVRAG